MARVVAGCTRHDGSRIRRLVETPLPDGDPDWSPDGSRIAFHARPNHVEDVWKQRLGEIWVASVRTRTRTPLEHRHYGYGEMDPVWSPDGRWIAFSSIDCLLNGWVCRAALWVMRPNGGADRRVTSSNQIENPSWSPDGSSIVFEDNPVATVGVAWDAGGGGGALVIVDVWTKKWIEVRAWLDQPSWGADGILVSGSTDDD